MKTCPNCKASVAPQIAICPMCAFSWQQPTPQMYQLAPHEARCIACSSIVTKGMRCVRCGVLNKSDKGFSTGTVGGVVLAVVLLIICMVIWNALH